MSNPTARSTKPGKRRREALPPRVNGRLGIQTRKVLQQHYRAKHGVK